MKLHEYQAKQLLANYGVPVPSGHVATTGSEASAAAEKLGGEADNKAQVHAGGRGKAGGVKLVKTHDEIRDFVKSMLGTRLVTFQTDEHGQVAGPRKRASNRCTRFHRRPRCVNRSRVR